jgi:hypothetical protein
MLRESWQTPEVSWQVWQSFDVATTMQEKKGVVERVQSLGRQPRAAASADGPDATAQPTRLAVRPEVKRGGGPAL